MSFPRKHLSWIVLGALLLGSKLNADESWPLWEAFKLRFVDPQGRVVDHDAQDRTTSEGQSYAMFFALVADDRPTFDRLLTWTEQNLAAGDLKSRLPAWLWGRAKDGAWHTLDKNSASDADLWISYTLLQAGRLWNSDRYDALGRALANRIAEEEVVAIPGLGPMLLPGPQGFHPSRDTYILNASYLPLQLIWNMSAHLPDGPWADIALNVPKLLAGSSRKGWVLDWIAYKPEQGFETQSLSQQQAKASYDAIRVYLWAGLLNDETFLKAKVLEALSGGMVPYLRNHLVPPAVVSDSGAVEQPAGNVGFSAALIPMLHAVKETSAASNQERRMKKERDLSTGLYGKQASYYDQCLALFATGWKQERFSFDAAGALEISWKF